MIEDRFLNIGEVMTIVGLGRTTIYARIKEGSFPRPIALGTRTVRWRHSVIMKWMDETEKKGLLKVG